MIQISPDLDKAASVLCADDPGKMSKRHIIFGPEFNLSNRFTTHYGICDVGPPFLGIGLEIVDKILFAWSVSRVCHKQNDRRKRDEWEPHTLIPLKMIILFVC